MPTMLYYPFAAAPANVIQQAVLYWDGLRTVVAPGWRSRLGPEMEAIRDRGFYTPIRPYRDYQRALTQDTVISDLRQALGEIGPLDVQIPEEPPALNSSTMLYEGKLNPGVVEMLITHGYAVRHPDSPSRLYGSPRLMYMVISIMASRIAADNNWRHGSEGLGSLYPHTDITTAFRLNVDPIAGCRVSDGWKVDIGPLLPVPGEGVDLASLWEFREKHESARVDMMNALAAFLGSLESLHPKDAYARVERQLADARNQLMRHGRESGIPLVIRRGAIVAVAVATDYAGQRWDIPGLGLGVATLGVVSGLAVNVASKSIHEQSGIEHDYRYLHLAESEFKNSGFPV